MAVLIFGIFCTRVFAKGPFRRPLSLRACGPRVLRWKTLRVSSAPHPGGFESHEMGPNKNGPLSRTVSNSVVGDEGCPRAAGAARAPLRRSAPRVLRWKTLRVSSAPHSGGFESLCTGPKKERPPSLGAFSIKWWAMRDVACGFAARFRFGPAALACCAGKRLRVSSAPHPGGFESLCDGPKQKRSPFEDRFQFSGGR